MGVRTSFSATIQQLRRFVPVFGGTLVVDLGSSGVKMGVRHNNGWQRIEIPTLSVQTRHGDIIAVGDTAREMIGTLSQDLMLVHPIIGGEIGEKKSVEMILKHGVRTLLAHSETSTVFHFFRNIILVLPAEVSRVQLRVAQQVASTIGGLEMSWVPIPIAQGWGTQVLHPQKQSAVIIDIGGSTTEVSVIAQNTVLNSQNIPIGGEHFTRAIHQFCRKELGVELGYIQAEAVKKQLSFSAKEQNVKGNSDHKKKKKSEKHSQDAMFQVKGRVVQTGLPTSLTLKQSQLQPVIDRIATELLSSIHQILTDIPPEMGEEVVRAGIVVVGGGSASMGLTELFRHRLGIPVHSESENVFSAIDGVSRLIEQGIPMNRIF